MKKSRLLVAATLSATLAACATSPTGRKQLMLVSEQQAISASRQAYVQEMGKYRQAGKLVDEPKLLRRVEVITGRLVAQAVKMRPDSARWDWSVAIIDDPKAVNAWRMAGGRMALYTGLLRQVDPTDDELAQVMAHEIAHALANHSAERMSVAMASQAGYDPRAAATLWQKMGAVGGGKSPPAFLSTHPSDQQRQQRLGALASKMMPYYQAPGTRPTHPVRVGAGAA